jgi:hypothetical protein
MSTERTISGKPDKRKMQTTQQIFHNLLEIVELYPQYSVSQHLAAISRRKNPNGKELFYWSDEELLKKIESHKSELEGDEFMNIVDDDINIE